MIIGMIGTLVALCIAVSSSISPSGANPSSSRSTLATAPISRPCAVTTGAPRNFPGNVPRTRSSRDSAHPHDRHVHGADAAAFVAERGAEDVLRRALTNACGAGRDEGAEGKRRDVGDAQAVTRGADFSGERNALTRDCMDRAVAGRDHAAFFP